MPIYDIMVLQYLMAWSWTSLIQSIVCCLTAKSDLSSIKLSGIRLGLALLTLSWDKNWASHSLVNGYPSFYPRIALVAPSPEWNFNDYTTKGFSHKKHSDRTSILRLEQNGCGFAGNIFKCIFLKKKFHILIKIPLSLRKLAGSLKSKASEIMFQTNEKPSLCLSDWTSKNFDFFLGQMKPSLC